MRRASRGFVAMMLTFATIGVAVAAAAPASACTGDVCDGFCIAYQSLPETVTEKVFHSESCPIESGAAASDDRRRKRCRAGAWRRWSDW